MKKLAIALMIICCASVAGAGTIYDIQVNGLYTPGDIVTANGVIVTAAAYNGVWVAECTNNPGEGIWVYLGSHAFVPGDILNITADYKEYYDLSELDAAGYDDVVPTDTVEFVCHLAAPEPIFVTATDIMLNAELYEGSFVQLIDGFKVTAMLSYGEWTAQSYDGGPAIHNDDIMFDETVLSVGSCYNAPVGAWHYAFGTYRLIPTADGIFVVDCAVGTAQTTFGALKSLFR